MDDSSNLPPGLRAPASGDSFTVTWQADIGPHVRVGQIGEHLRDLGAVTDLGERWGAELAREAALRSFVDRVRREGPAALEALAKDLSYRSRDVHDLFDWIEFGWWPPRPARRSSPWPSMVFLEAAAETQIPRFLGRSTFVRHARYENPIEVVLGGSGLSLVGVVYVLRLIRDWSNRRREGQARAGEAEADARERHAHADEAEARADFARWLVDEVKSGRIVVPPSELLSLVTQRDIEAVDRLARNTVQLQLPEDLDRSRRKLDDP